MDRIAHAEGLAAMWLQTLAQGDGAKAETGKDYP